MSKLVSGLLIFCLGFGVGWYVFSMQAEVSQKHMVDTGAEQKMEAGPEKGVMMLDEEYVTESTESSEPETTQTQVDYADVYYTDVGFEPATITISPNTLVRFTNNASTDMWVVSDLHPTHQLLPGFDQGEVGLLYEYVFEKSGTWTYHNEMNLKDTGTVVVN